MNLIRYVELSLLLILAVVSDIKFYKIKNKILLPFMMLGILTNFIASGINGLKFSLVGLFIPMVILIVLYALKMLGAGDIKLFCAIGSMMGLLFCLYIMAYSFIAGGAISLLIIILRKNGKERLKVLVEYFKACLICFTILPYSDFKETGDGGKFHFAIAIAVGTCLYIAI